jgi:hypothetical protein
MVSGLMVSDLQLAAGYRASGLVHWPEAEVALIADYGLTRTFRLIQPHLHEGFSTGWSFGLAQLPPLHSDFTTASACGRDASL